MQRMIGAPTDLGGCLLWLDASDAASVIRDGSNLVSQWRDKSGNSNHAVQATAANQPSYSATAFGGLPCLDWGNGEVSARSLVTPSINYGVHTVFFAVRGNAGSIYLYVHETANGSPNREMLAGDPSPHCLMRRAAGAQSGRVVAPLSSTGAFLRDATRHIICKIFNGTHASNQVRQDGVLQQCASLAGTTADPGTSLSNGVVIIGNAETFLHAHRGLIAEVIIFSRALSDGEIVVVEQYLARKWNLATQLTRQIASPLELSDCAMWFDAGQGVTHDVNGVSQWNDSSGNARHIAQSDNAFKPTYNPSNPAFGGRPTVDWDTAGNGDRLDRGAADNLAQPLTVIACCSLVPGTSNIALFDNQAGSEWGFGRVLGTAILYVFSPSLNFPMPAGVAAGKAFTLAIQHNGLPSRSLVKIDGATAANGTTNAAGSISSFRLGSFINGFTTSNWVGSIAEFIVYRRRLVEGEIAAAETYLQRKYGL